jgi:hypothetical protein
VEKENADGEMSAPKKMKISHHRVEPPGRRKMPYGYHGKILR